MNKKGYYDHIIKLQKILLSKNQLNGYQYEAYYNELIETIEQALINGYGDYLINKNMDKEVKELLIDMWVEQD